MEEQKERKYIKYFLLILLLYLISNLAYNIYKNRGWNEEFTCTNWDFFDNISAQKGNRCVLEDCISVKTELNTDVKKCRCLLNNETIYKKCTDKTKLWRYQP